MVGERSVGLTLPTRLVRGSSLERFTSLDLTKSRLNLVYSQTNLFVPATHIAEAFMYAVRVGGAAAPRSPGAHQHHRRKREEPMIEGRVEQKKTKTLHTHFAFHRLPLWRRPSLNAGVRTRLGVMSLLCGFAPKSEACAASVGPGIPGPPRCQSGVACLVLGSILNKEGHSAGSAAYRTVCSQRTLSRAC